jgi:hypothetical protein
MDKRSLSGRFENISHIAPEISAGDIHRPAM